ncbi:hypothetical protein [Cryptosporidium parvum Iowa II]|uniref:Uncharacterized protein n=1 Tax=Cryptosporidium parvum (strain Iowa II) TaxID=353152 RepID=Q5CRU6_CRYPI|nr:hypothetical protein [Cryptosporidium parvum Iowa II]EAK88106.1 hypothetical protein cgd5_1430 [Cryptosporidium parvum Iowa II]WKS77796.1 hypothetical protein CPCDC_5g1430 [Cryptosporidium sp. 43IA8]
MIPKFNLVFLILFILIKIEYKRLIVMAKDSSDKIAKRFFVNQDKPQWQRTQAPREEIAIICHILSLGPIECIKYNEREFDGANPGHEEYMGKENLITIMTTINFFRVFYPIWNVWCGCSCSYKIEFSK